MSSISQIISDIAKNSTKENLYYNGTHVFKSGIFDPVKQVIQGISYDDTSILDDIKVYSSAGLKYLLIPPGTEILVSFAGGNPSQPFLAGVDPMAKVQVGLSSEIFALADITMSAVTGGIAGTGPITPGETGTATLTLTAAALASLGSIIILKPQV